MMPLRGLVCLGLLLGIWQLSVATLGSERPNVLLICADDHAAHVFGAYGNQQVRTPHLDRLAAGGMRFDRAYCNSPVCTASRAAFITGRYPRTLGVTQLRTPLPDEEVTLAEMLGAAGYATAVIGKTHFNSKLTHGFELLVGDREFQTHMKSRGQRELPAGMAVLPPWRPFRVPATEWLNSEVLPYGAVDADMKGTFFAEQACAYLSETHTRPFFLYLSFQEPHSPFHFPVEFAGRYSADEFEVPHVAADDQWQVPAIFRDLTEQQKRGIVASYYTSVEYLDQNVGRVLEALAASPYADNTVIVYIGDHGYMLGEHGRFEKHCMFEPAVRSPLLVIDAQRVEAGTSSDCLVEFIDIVPTLLERCGVPIPEQVQGRSFGAVLAGQTDEHRDVVFVEYAENAEAMLATKRWKFIYGAGNRRREDGYDPGGELPGPTVQLYDREQDPDELNNLAKQPEQKSRVDAFMEQLHATLLETARQSIEQANELERSTRLDDLLQPRDVGGR